MLESNGRTARESMPAGVDNASRPQADDAARAPREGAPDERRRHRIYVTRNTEYHVRDGVCVAVRCRRSGEFLRGHLARGQRVEGGLRFLAGSIQPNGGEPQAGECLYFTADGRDLVTSALLEVLRPSKALTTAYAAPEELSLRSA